MERDKRDICRDKCSSLVNLIRHIDMIRDDSRVSKSVLDELKADNKTILREIGKLKKRLDKNK
jgi:hypothetical protein